MQFVATARYLALAIGLLALASPARADLVTFESDPTGIKPNGFQSSDSTHVSFSATPGRELDLSNFGSQGDGQSLASSPDDPAGKLLMTFTQPYNFLSLSFGNCSFQGTAFLLRIDPLKRLNRRSRAVPGNMDCR